MTGVTFTYGLIGVPETLDPHFASSSSAIHLLRNSYNGLVTTDLDSNGDPVIVGDLASGWTYDSTDFTYTFTLLDDVYFHSLNQFDAYAAAFSVNRMTAGPLGSRFNSISSVTTPDDYTLVIDLSIDDPSFLADLAHPMAVMVDPATLAGTGPFKMTAYDAVNGADFEAYDDYHESDDITGIDGLEVAFFTDLSIASSALSAGAALGGVDYVANVPAHVASDWVDQSSGALSMPSSVSSGGMTYLAFNFLPEDPQDTTPTILSDVLLRQAINSAIDRDTLVDTVMNGSAEAMWGVLPGSHAMHGGTNETEFDTGIADTLLNQAGWLDHDNVATTPRVKNNEPLTLTLAYDDTNDLHAAAAAQVQAMLANVGIGVTLEGIDHNDFVAGEYYADISLFSRYGLDGQDAEDWLYPTFLTGGSENVAGFSDVSVDAALEDAVTETNPTDRETAWQNAEGLINDEAPVATLFGDALVGVWNAAAAPVIIAQVGQPVWQPKQKPGQLANANGYTLTLKNPAQATLTVARGNNQSVTLVVRNKDGPVAGKGLLADFDIRPAPSTSPAVSSGGQTNNNGELSIQISVPANATTGDWTLRVKLLDDETVEVIIVVTVT